MISLIRHQTQIISKVHMHIAFGIKKEKLSAEEEYKRVVDAIQKTGLSEEVLEKSVYDLSGGQKRRVAIAGVLATQPEFLILDEPAAGLDPKGREEILKVHCRNKPLEETVDLRKIAQVTIGFTGAELANLMNEAALLAAKKDKALIGMQETMYSTSWTDLYNTLKKDGYDGFAIVRADGSQNKQV